MSYNLTGASYGGSVSLSKAGLAAGTTTTYTVANTFTFAVRGRLYSQAAASNAASPVTDANTGVAFKPLAAGLACVFLFMVDKTGVVRVAQGPLCNTADIANGLAGALMPGLADDSAPFGYLLAQAGSNLASPWTFGVGNLSGVTGMTYTFNDLMDIPAHPVIN